MSEVVVYVSEDQVFSEPILRDLEKETGIKVKAVYDTEETKSSVDKTHHNTGTLCQNPPTIP